MKLKRNNIIETTFYSKPTNSDKYLNWKSFGPNTWKRSTPRNISKDGFNTIGSSLKNVTLNWKFGGLCRLKREPNTISSWYLVHEKNGYKFFNIPKTLVNFLYIFLIDQLEYLPTMSYNLETKRNSWRQRFDRWFQLKRWWCWQFQCISKNLVPVISNLHMYVKKVCVLTVK